MKVLQEIDVLDYQCPAETDTEHENSENVDIPTTSSTIQPQIEMDSAEIPKWLKTPVEKIGR